MDFEAGVRGGRRGGSLQVNKKPSKKGETKNSENRKRGR